MASIVARSVEGLKSRLNQLLSPDLILDVCRSAGHQWRTRILDPVTTIWMFAYQILYGNTSCTHAVRLLRGVQVTDSGYCQARSRLPLEVFNRLMRRIAAQFHEEFDSTELWRGHRVVIADGSSCSMPDTPTLQARFGQPSGQRPGCGFPVAHLLGFFGMGSGMLVDLVTSPMNTHDLSIVRQLHRRLRRGDVFMGDRAFCSYVHSALLMRRGVHAVFRIHQGRHKDFRRGRCLGRWDRQVTWNKPTVKPAWISQATFDRIPQTMTIRELRYEIKEPGFRTEEVTLATTLLDPVAYPADQLAALYNRRWEVETNFRHLKQTLGMDVLKCETVDGVKKELMMFVVIYNLVRAIMFEAGLRQEVPPDRISFADVLRWLTIRQPGDPLPQFVVVPRRKRPSEPRKVKRRPKQFGRLTQPRATLRKALMT